MYEETQPIVAFRLYLPILEKNPRVFLSCNTTTKLQWNLEYKYPKSYVSYSYFKYLLYSLLDKACVKVSRRWLFKGLLGSIIFTAVLIIFIHFFLVYFYIFAIALVFCCCKNDHKLASDNTNLSFYSYGCQKFNVTL